MSLHRARFVTACQQLLALGAVLAVLTPAANLVSLDVVPHGNPAPSSHGVTAGALAAYERAAEKPTRVPTAPVDPTVHEYALTAPAGARTVAGGLQARTRSTGEVQRLVSLPQPVTGYGAIGVTWAHGEDVPETDLQVQARTRTDGAWSGWTTVPYEAEHGPDPDSREGRHARPGTDPLLVGTVDDVQVRVVDSATSTGRLPTDMRLAVIDPGHARHTVVERAAIDTSTLDDGEVTPAADSAAGSAVTPKPQIFSRAQWGADESMRDKPSLHYGEVHAGFVHHTVNANDYTRAQVPSLLRGIYAYHTQSRGWSDIGYNYLVDRFGRIWEGRYGGVDRPVVGAHTLGYNDYSFAMSAIGNYEVAQPSEATVEAYGALFAWKLSLHGVAATSTSQKVAGDTFQAINGHRDAGQTACPGKYLYARIPEIRTMAAAAQASWAGRELDSDQVGTPHPDLVVRRASDGRVLIIPTAGLSKVRKPVVAATGFGGYAGVLVTPDVTGDGRADVLGVTDTGLDVHPGSPDGTVGATLRTVSATTGDNLLAAPGDLDGDGRADLVGRDASGHPVRFLGNGAAGFKAQTLTGDWTGYDLLAGAGDLDADGHADLVARDADGTLWFVPGTAEGFGTPSVLLAGGDRYDTVTALGDLDGDGHADLLARRTGGNAFVLPGHGDGTVGKPLGPVKRLKGRPGLAGGGDLVGSTAYDLVSLREDDLLVYANTGKHEVDPVVDTGVNARRADLLLNAGDWDGDGHGDLMMRVKGRLKVRPGDGLGGYGKAVRIGTGFGDVRLLDVVGDVTGDGRPDLMGQPQGGDLRIYPGQGDSPLGPGYVAHSAVSASQQIGVGRWDADGAPDSLFRQGDKLVVWSGNGPGGLFGSPRTLPIDLADYDLVAGIHDEHLTGHPDLVLRDKADGDLWLVQASATGFKAPRLLAEGAEGYDLVD